MSEQPAAPAPDASESTAGVTTKSSPAGVRETVERLLELLAARQMKVFAVIDQREEARAVGLDLRETTLVLFGNPAAGTPVMTAAPLAALDLPLKVVVWADEDGTRLSYTSPAALAARYGLDAELLAPLAGVDALADGLIEALS